MRYYFVSAQENLKPYLNGSFGFGKRKRERVDSETNIVLNDVKEDLRSINFDVGLAIFLKEYASLDVSLGYTLFQYSEDADFYEKESGISLTFGFSLFL